MRAVTRPARCDRRHTTRDQPLRASKEPLCVSTSFVGYLELNNQERLKALLIV